MRSRRGLGFVLLTTICVVVAVGFVLWSALGSRGASEAVAETVQPVSLPRDAVIFRSLDRADAKAYGRVAIVSRTDPSGPRELSGLTCERVYYAAGQGICLAKTGAVKYVAVLFGSDFRPTHEVALSGFPSRARISPDGRYASATVFAAGHSYASPGQFSTTTTIMDTASGTVVADLEKDFTVTKDGKAIDSPDFNFWGVTFAADSNRFYATLGTAGATYLIEGDVQARTAQVVHENVECPSLSPDGTRIAYKLVGDSGVWRFHVLDLATMTETPLAETKPIDDQIEWLDDDSVLYRVDEEIWTVPADGTGSPERYLAAADSPAVVRP